MRMRRIINVLLQTASLFVAAASLNALELVEVKTITVTGAGNPIKQIAFKDVDGDGIPEFLAASSPYLSLYSPNGDTLLFRIDYDSVMQAAVGLQSGCYPDPIGIWLGDVNRDGAADAMLLLATPDRNCSAQSMQYYMLFIDNIVSPARHVSVVAYAGQYGPSQSAYDGALTALDLNADGYDEVFVGLDSLPPIPFHLYDAKGRTFIYYSFPSVRYDVWPFQVSRYLGTPLQRIGSRLIASVKSSAETYYPSGDIRSFSGSMELLDTYGSTLQQETDTMPLMCHGTKSTYVINLLNYQCAGDMISATPETEVLATSYRRQVCRDSLPNWKDTLIYDESGNSLIMYRFVNPDSLAEVWRSDLLSNDYRCYYHPRFPGHFFTVNQQTFSDLSGLDGHLIDSYTSLPLAPMYWLRPFGDGDPSSMGPDYLVVADGTKLRIFGIDDATDVEINAPAVLPETFTLGQPYPNPFNPTVTIPISVDHKGHLRVEVFNLLGQAVGVVYDGKAGPGEMNLVWDAKGVPSGVYFFRVVFDDLPKTVSAMLVK